MSNTTPQELFDTFEEITESDNRVNAGRADALIHVGKLLSGEWSPEFVSSIQDELADTTRNDYSAKHHFGYLTAWNTASGLLKGESLKSIAKKHG